MKLASGAISRRVAAGLLGWLPLLGGCDKSTQETTTRPSAPPIGSSPSHFTTAGKNLPVVYPPTPPAPKPIGPLAANVSCVSAECHADLTRAAQIHGPVAQRECASCHGPDTGTHAFPLKREGDATCTYCHAVSGTQLHQHKALEGGCLTCHRPHVSQTKFLLKADSVGQQCATCHEIPLSRFAHDAVAKGECTDCHWPHQSDTAGLLRGGEGAQHCLSCHETIRTSLQVSAKVHEPAKQDCRRCHETHTSQFAHLMRSEVEQNCLGCHEKIARRVASAPVQHSAMVTENRCANCHQPHAAEDPSLLRDRMDRVCLSCHDKPLRAADGHQVVDMKRVISESQFLHGPLRSGSCSGCHDPHGADFASLLEHDFPKAFYTSFEVGKYQLCFKCHRSEMVTEARTTGLTGFRDGDRNLHFVHVNRDEKGRTCRTCHALHGSNLPRHMASEVPFEGSNWSMPIEFELKPDGGSCAPGCHAPQTYRRSAATLPASRGEP